MRVDPAVCISMLLPAAGVVSRRLKALLCGWILVCTPEWVEIVCYTQNRLRLCATKMSRTCRHCIVLSLWPAVY